MITLKSERELDLMRKSGRLLGRILKDLETRVKPGVSTLELNDWVESQILRAGAVPSFKGYRGFPAAACMSLNEAVVHGIPTSTRRLKEGDIVGIDVGVHMDGYHTDAARTYPVGEISGAAKRLIAVTRECFFTGIGRALSGGRVGDISSAVQETAEAAGFSVVESLTGHGIGKRIHEDPDVPNFGRQGRGPRLKPGMTLAVEPMINAGDYQVEQLEDGWTVVTCDGSLSAHYENTIVIREDGLPEILTEHGEEGDFS